ncbi:hypothetical protein [Thalassorhabdomicrobium marinisediminis]|uniref:hypothetical protein n=1 Tax=Thalassorhabdomicrobium marinisediminis TaxID=2170577 RepID=UPI00249373DF|nr:hypothetical protein [Thalassorhabdomicrobium marinisediminis]
MAKGDATDPKGLIEEAYRIEGISTAECRSIFLDWALSVAGDSRRAVRALQDRHRDKDEDHPMSRVLAQAVDDGAPPVRRGGRRGRTVG